MDRFGHLAQRLFNVPLMIHPRKAEVVLAALSDRLGLVRPIAFNPEIFFEDGEDDLFTGARQTVGRDEGYDLVEGIAFILISGTLVQRLGTLRPYSGMTGYDGIRQAYLTAMGDPEAKAVMFAIDSPGGEVAGCFDLCDQIYELRGEKPVWAVLSENAYSAAYAIASSCDRIIVPRTGGTGSIGVICMHVDLSAALKNGGINVTFIKKGERKADGRPELPLSPEALEHAQAEIDYMGGLFDGTVARNRGLSIAAVSGMEAATFIGPRGVEAGLADAVMAPDEAFRALLAASA